jgi:peptidoglycan/xylan/chitin deacetylase (PgdA/CDA1 family)
MSKGLVLNYHKEEDAGIFEKMIIALKKKYRLLTLEELEKVLNNNLPLKNTCHITFDDGERSFYDIVFPILKKHAVPVSLFVSPQVTVTRNNFWFQEMEVFDQENFKQFVVKKLDLPAEKTIPISLLAILKCLSVDEIKKLILQYQEQAGILSRPPQNMTTEEVLEVDNSGFVIVGAHTQNHPILKNETAADSKTEIQSSISSLEKILGHQVKYFAFPNGVEGLDFEEREIQSLKESNIAIAFSTRFDHLSLQDNRYKIPRMSFPQMLNLPPAHPLISLRLSLGRRWISFRSNPPSEIEMRQAALALFKNRHAV